MSSSIGIMKLPLHGKNTMFQTTTPYHQLLNNLPLWTTLGTNRYAYIHIYIYINTITYIYPSFARKPVLFSPRLSDKTRADVVASHLRQVFCLFSRLEKLELVPWGRNAEMYVTSSNSYQICLLHGEWLNTDGYMLNLRNTDHIRTMVLEYWPIKTGTSGRGTKRNPAP